MSKDRRAKVNHIDDPASKKAEMNSVLVGDGKTDGKMYGLSPTTGFIPIPTDANVMLVRKYRNCKLC